MFRLDKKPSSRKKKHRKLSNKLNNTISQQLSTWLRSQFHKNMINMYDTPKWVKKERFVLEQAMKAQRVSEYSYYSA